MQIPFLFAKTKGREKPKQRNNHQRRVHYNKFSKKCKFFEIYPLQME